MSNINCIDFYFFFSIAMFNYLFNVFLIKRNLNFILLNINCCENCLKLSFECIISVKESFKSKSVSIDCNYWAHLDIKYRHKLNRKSISCRTTKAGYCCPLVAPAPLCIRCGCRKIVLTSLKLFSS